MMKILLAHSGIEDGIIYCIKEKLQFYIKMVLGLEDVSIIPQRYDVHYDYSLDDNELILLCNTSTKVNWGLLPKNPNVIPVVFDENSELKRMNQSIQSINFFCFNKNVCNKSIKLLSEVILSRMGLMKNARKVFISYKRSETDKLAEYVRKELLKEGFSVFLDKSDIDVGTDFMQEIRYSIAESDIFLMLNSKTYYDSIYTKKELYAACISGLAIIVLSQENTMAKDLCGLTCIHISEIDKINEPEKKKLIEEIEDARTKLWQSRHNRLNNKLLMFKEYEKSLQGFYVPTKSERIHKSIFPIVGLPTTMDFQRIKQYEKKEDYQDANQSVGKVYAFYDNLSLPSSYSRHLDWLDKEMPNVNLVNTSRFEEEFSNEITMMKNKTPIVFLSASVPNSDDNEYDFITIHDIVVTLTETIAKTNGTMVFGGHPTITPIIVNIMDIMSNVDEETNERNYPNIYLFQSKFFKEMYPPEVKSFPKDHLIETEIIKGNSKEESKHLSLKVMRDEMITSQQFTHAIFIGGKFEKSEGTETSGVWDEYKKFSDSHPNAKCLYFENTGSVPAELAKSFKRIEKTTTDNLPHKLCDVD